MSDTRYVLMVVIDPATGFTVGITKKKGPAFLLGRVTFPGGKMEDGESPAQAASREMLEETGVSVPEADWQCIEVRFGDGFELHVLAALSRKVLHARQLEEEPVWHLAYTRHFEYARRQPAQYAPDFVEVLSGALNALGVPVPDTATA